MATYAIGDIQGCFDDFTRLLAKIEFKPSRDQLWLTGDLVNRGPKSLDVLRYVRKHEASIISVLGNHDLHLLAVAAGEAKRKKLDTLDEVLAAPDRDSLLDWLSSRPLLHQDDEIGFTMLHAGLAPQWTLRLARDCAREVEAVLREKHREKFFAHMYGDQPDLWSDDLKGFDRLRFITNCFTRMRCCDADGRIQLKYKGTLEEMPKGLYPWFRAPHRRSAQTRIICGHWSAIDYHVSDHVFAIDSGCVWGARLCAIRLDTPAPQPIFTRCHSSTAGAAEE
jgi:bis(5'-nucleosyl)-tetraphosphatase (symmetrical)